ncbi:branched-chain amino acid ABC transporter permease, partial [Myxococcus sp. CA039A]|nr:branched-chain amino acid ABC transporter permease [Myxococcus sp. CA039A]
AVGNPELLGLDAAFPASMLALLLPSLLPPKEADAPDAAKSRATKARRVALVGALIALVATPLLPAGVPVLLSILAVGVALR